MHTRGWHDKTCPHIGKRNLGVLPGEVPRAHPMHSVDNLYVYTCIVKCIHS